MLPRRFRSSVAGASCGSGRLAIGFRHWLSRRGICVGWSPANLVRARHRGRSWSVAKPQWSPSVKPSASNVRIRACTLPLAAEMSTS
jgi:hypothetical protein